MMPTGLLCKKTRENCKILMIVREVLEKNAERPKHCRILINTMTGRKSSKQGIIKAQDED